MSLVLFLFLFFIDCSHTKSVYFTDDQNKIVDILYELTKYQGPYSFTCLKKRHNVPFIYRVDYQDQSCVVRLNKDQNVQFFDEIALHFFAQEQEFGPRIMYANSDEGIIIMEYLINEQLHVPLDTHQTDLLISFVKKMHKSSFLCKSSETFVTDVLNRFAKRLASNCFGLNLYSLYESLKFLEYCIDKTVKPVFVHGDLHMHNLFFCQNSCKAIDFETAHYDNPYVDLTCLMLDFCPDSAAEINILKRYLDRPVNQHDIEQYTIFKLFNVVSFALWMLNQAENDFGYANNCSEKFYIKPLIQFLQDSDNNQSNQSWRYCAIIAALKEAENLVAFLQNSFSSH